MFIFDTNAFNSLLDDEGVSFESISKLNIYASYVQLKELNATKNQARRKKLVNCFHEAVSQKKPIETQIFPLVFGEQKFGDGTFEEIRDMLNDSAERLSSKKKRQKLANNAFDALIGEVAEKNNYILVTGDNDFSKIMKQRGVSSLKYEEFKLQYINM